VYDRDDERNKHGWNAHHPPFDLIRYTAGSWKKGEPEYAGSGAVDPDWRDHNPRLDWG
jgi:hypothetical protein